jgi:hypothetical protein
MSQAGPILFVSNAQRPAFISALDGARFFPVIDSGWSSAAHAVDEVQPAAVVAALSSAHERHLAAVAAAIAGRTLYLPFFQSGRADARPRRLCR